MSNFIKTAIMKKMYVPTFLGRIVLFLVFSIVSMSGAFAQLDIQIGTGNTGNGTTTYPCPVQDYYEGSRAQFMYTAQELIAAGAGPGNILGIKFRIVSVDPGQGEVEQFTIKIGTTSLSSLDLTSWVPVSTVYGPVNLTPSVGTAVFNFTVPFFWNGLDNIVVETCDGSPNSTAGITWTDNPEIPWTTGLPFNGSHTYRADDENVLCGTASTTNFGTATTRPNITFTWVPADTCDATPAAGNANATTAFACVGERFNLSVTGQTLASGLTYQWQLSQDSINWADIPNGDKFSISVSQDTTNYYRVKITCVNAGQPAFSTSVKVSSPGLVGGVYTINKNQPSGGTNFKSFNDAYNFIKCGINGPVVFNVVPGSGPYDEQLIITPIGGASGVNTITFNGNGDTLRFLSTNTSERATIKLRGADHFIFDSLVIVALGDTSTEFGYGVHLLNAADSNTVRRCSIISNIVSNSANFAGIVVNGVNGSVTTNGYSRSGDNTFERNKIIGGYYGIAITAGDTSGNYNTVIKDNEIRDFHEYGMYFQVLSFGTIKNNIIHRPNRQITGNFTGIYFVRTSTACVVDGNRISNPFGNNQNSALTSYGIYVTNNDGYAGFGLENKYINNLMYNFTGNGSVYGIYNSNSDNSLYYHNTIILDGNAPNSLSTSVIRGFYQTGTAGGIEFRNNIVALSRAGLANKHAMYFNTAASVIVSDDNDFYITAKTGLVNLGSNIVNGSALNSPNLAAWKTNSAQDQNSITSNPIFASPLTFDFRPNSPALDSAGAVLTVPIYNDIDDNPRDSSYPDMGAYEFKPKDCVAPIVAGTAVSDQTVVCENSAVAIGLAGNSFGLKQTYQWQVATAPGGPFTDLGLTLTNPDTTIIAPSASTYYRAKISCSGTDVFSTPVFLLVNPALPAGTYTINKNLPTGGTNFTSFAAVRSALECGIRGPVVFNVVAGTGPYVEQFELDSIRGASAINTVTFNGNADTLRFAPFINESRAVIKLRRADHVTFNNLVVDADVPGAAFSYGIQLYNDADSNTINNCTILVSTNKTSVDFAGIVVNASETNITSSGPTLCDYNTFSNNKIYGGYSGVTIVGGNNDPIYGNKVINNLIQDFYNTGVWVQFNADAQVSGNDISRISRDSILLGFTGVNVTSLNQRTVINGNRIHDPFSGAVQGPYAFPASQSIAINVNNCSPTVGNEVKVVNNVIYNFLAAGNINGLSNNNASNIHYYHNTISFDDLNNTSEGTTSGFVNGGFTTVTGLEVKNNIITIRRTGSGNKFGLQFTTGGANIASDNNNIFVNGNLGISAYGFFNANRITLANWQTTGKDLNSKDFDPEYADPAVGNFEPLMTAMDNLGTPVGVSNDVRSFSRSATKPDVGAYEFVIDSCINPPTAAAASVVPNSALCVGQKVRLDLIGYTKGAGQTFQWQSSNDGVNWTNISEQRFVSRYDWEMTIDTIFRCVMVCKGATVPSPTTSVFLNPPLAPGVYTINKNQPASLTNYQTFQSVVDKLECGIGGHVTFLVSADNYNERIRMRKVGGAGPNARVTFIGVNQAASVLEYKADSARNYTLRLDSASFITFKNMTIKALDTLYGRAVEFAAISSNDSIYNCSLISTEATAANTLKVAVYARALRGSNNTISNNNILNGAYGIYWEGNNVNDLAYNHSLDSNTINAAFAYGIYSNFCGKLSVRRNAVIMTPPNANNYYGIYVKDADSAYRIDNNVVQLESGIGGTGYGMYITQSNARAIERGSISGNNISSSPDNNSIVYGLYLTGNNFGNVLNNVISVTTQANTCYGLYSTTGSDMNVYNNTVNNWAGVRNNTNTAAYFNHTSGGNGRINIRNNIFSHTNEGVAVTYNATSLNFIYSDYNFYYTNGTVLINRSGTLTYPNLQQWINFSNWDLHSMVYKPAFISDEDLRPDLNSPDVWAMHGRGVQIVGNDKDIDGNPRPTVITDGVPDMGAYEFLPISIPTELSPLGGGAPVPGGFQVFMYGSDTVATLRYAPGSTVPADVKLRRYSGVLPQGLTAQQKSMYYYLDFGVTGSQPSKYSIKHYYIESWQGFIPDQAYAKLGEADNTNNWAIRSTSIVNDVIDFFTDSNITTLAKMTGLLDTAASNITENYVPQADSSNRGKRFWVGYGHHYGFENSNDQTMVLYLSAEEDANVTVRVNNTAYQREYFVPAGTVTVSQPLPKNGLFDSRLLIDGKSDKGILIESDVPIVAYAHIYLGATSEAAMLLPVGTYGYEYTSINSTQNYQNNLYSWAMVIADRDSTVVEITPANPCLAGRPAKVPFTVTLKRGEVYQVLGAIIGGAEGYDMTGTKFKSKPNYKGECYPFAVFSGSSRTALGCGTNLSGSGDNLLEQNFPFQAWGKKYLVAPTSNASAANSFHTNIYRVAIKDTATKVFRNGVQLTGLRNGFYYQFESNTADKIEADKPIVVSQLMSSSGNCPNTGGNGDPAMIYVSPIEQGIKHAGLYRNSAFNIAQQYVTLVVPNGGLPSLTIDGSNTFTHQYVHTNDPNYTVVVQRWNGGQGQVVIDCDSAFTAITYGLGSVESYGYNAGTLVKNLNAQPTLTNTLGTGASSSSTCENAPFKLSIKIALRPTQMNWLLSRTPGLQPNADIRLTNPVPLDSVESNGEMYYFYEIAGVYSFNKAGDVIIPIEIFSPAIEGCNSKLDVAMPIKVFPAPVADFVGPLFGCLGQTLAFNGTSSTAAGLPIPVKKWEWDLGWDPGVRDTSSKQNVSYQYADTGSYDVSLSFITVDGCLGDTVKTVKIIEYPEVELEPDTISTCANEDVTFRIKNPVNGYIYRWYTDSTGGTLLSTNLTYTIPSVSSNQTFYVEAIAGICTTTIRKAAIIIIESPLDKPVVKVLSSGTDFIEFGWNSVPRAIGYEVSSDSGATWTAPSSGSLGTTHRVDGLTIQQTLKLLVRALAFDSCQNSDSFAVGTAIANYDVFIPNAFTPNGDGVNEYLEISGNGVVSVKFLVFNQWGQKVSEVVEAGTSLTRIKVWDGTQKGKAQPSGVYMYVAEFVVREGTEQVKKVRKGSINLIR